MASNCSKPPKPNAIRVTKSKINQGPPVSTSPLVSTRLSSTGPIHEPKLQLLDLVESWRGDPVKFVREAIGVEPSEQQQEGLKAIRCLELVRLYQDKGLEIPYDLKDFEGKFGLSIRSGKGTGKDAFMAWLMIRACVCFLDMKGMVTAPVRHQLEGIVLAEVSLWLNRRNAEGQYCCPIKDWVTVQSNKIYFTAGGGRSGFIELRTANPNDNPENQAETLAGRHRDYLFIYVTEASGVPNAVFRPIETTLTGKCNFAVLVWNPTKTSGYAYETHYGKQSKHQWIRLHWDAEKSPIVKKEHIESIVKKYGRESNMFRIMVKGNPPLMEEGTLIPWDWVELAMESSKLDVEPEEGIVMGVDVGRTGDKSAICIRQGPKVHSVIEFASNDLTVVASRVMEEISEWEPERVCIDVCGLGWGVFDMVKKHYDKVYAVNVASSAKNTDRFDRLRDELWWQLRERLEAGTLSLPEDDDLKGELTSIKYEVQGKDKIKIENKKQMKTRGLGSPNKADSLIVTFAFKDVIFKKQQEERQRYKRRQEPEIQDWMGA